MTGGGRGLAEFRAGSSRRQPHWQAGPGAAGLHYDRAEPASRIRHGSSKPRAGKREPELRLPSAKWHCPLARGCQWHERASGAALRKMVRPRALGLSSPRKLQALKLGRRAGSGTRKFRSDGTRVCLHAAAASTFLVRRSSGFKLELAYCVPTSGSSCSVSEQPLGSALMSRVKAI